MYVSEEFHNLLRKKPFIWDTFDWQETKKIKIENTERRVLLFRVEQIFAMDGSSSEELLEPQYDMLGKEAKEAIAGGAGQQDQRAPAAANKEHPMQNMMIGDEDFVYN